MEQKFEKNYNISGFTIKIVSDLPILDDTFSKKFESFEAKEIYDDVVTIHHHFKLPSDMTKEGKLLYKANPWEIYHNGDKIIYWLVLPDGTVAKYSIFDYDHKRGHIYHASENVWGTGKQSLTLFPTDQVIITRLLPQRNATYLHSAGVILDGEGLIFCGHSTAGKTTISKMLEPQSEILCDDRNIIRLIDGRYNLFGTWSHGELDQVSSSYAPLRGIYFLEKATYNKIEEITDKKIATYKVLSTIVKGLETKDWWSDVLSVVTDIAVRIPVYNLYFDKSGDIVKLLKK